jgi:alanine racemase
LITYKSYHQNWYLEVELVPKRKEVIHLLYSGTSMPAYNSTFRPTFIQVSLKAIRSNIAMIREITQTPIMAVVKANAYGHGTIDVARAAEESGVDWFGVAFSAEGLALRKAGIQANILVMGYTPPELSGDAIENDLSLTVYDPILAREYSKCARALGRTARLHVKVDTGMGRLGMLPSNAIILAKKIKKMKGLHLEGVFSHFASADETDLSFTRLQCSQFQLVLDEIMAASIRPDFIHAANSAGALRLPEARYDLVRMGIALYGLHPSREYFLPVGFKPALQWKTRVSQVRWLDSGTPISYGRTYFTRSCEQIAVLPVGYADGYRRSPPNISHVLINGVRVPVVGRVCMDQLMVDATAAGDIQLGDEAVLIGDQNEARISAEDVAEWWGTINYEVVSGILARVPRIYDDF